MMTSDRASRWQRPTAAAWLAIICVTSLMLGLGFWQLARLEWKEALMASIARGVASPPESTLPHSALLLKEQGFKRFAVRGELLHQHELHLAARYYRSKLGYHIITPLKLEDGRVLLVNRGWVPTDKKESATRPETIVWGMQHYTVMLRTDRDYTFFTPDHDISHNIWFWRDIPQMRKATKLPLMAVSGDVVMENLAPDMLPIPADGNITLRNDHLGYAVTWFMVALAGVIIFILYHRSSASS